MRNENTSRMDVSGLDIVEKTIKTRDFEVDGITAITFAWSDERSRCDEQVEAIKDALWEEYQWVRRERSKFCVKVHSFPIGAHPSGSRRQVREWALQMSSSEELGSAGADKWGSVFH